MECGYVPEDDEEGQLILRKLDDLRFTIRDITELDRSVARFIPRWCINLVYTHLGYL